MSESHRNPAGPDPHEVEGAEESADAVAESAAGAPDEPAPEAESGLDESGPDESGADESGADQASEDELTVTKMELAERTADLQRLQAEFLNYKRRVERDRELQVENTTFKVLTPIIEVLDTIDRAREHGPLEEGFQAVADQLQNAVASQGLTRFGEPGEEFDPNLHDALSHLGEDPEVTVTTVKVVPKAGYRIADRVVRAAQVLVVDPPSA